ncbi:hypothetical protein PMAYCL1PPCAC_01032, partial [Pristionchus mayeri]
LLFLFLLFLLLLSSLLLPALPHSDPDSSLFSSSSLALPRRMLVEPARERGVQCRLNSSARSCCG